MCVFCQFTVLTFNSRLNDITYITQNLTSFYFLLIILMQIKLNYIKFCSNQNPLTIVTLYTSCYILSQSPYRDTTLLHKQTIPVYVLFAFIKYLKKHHFAYTQRPYLRKYPRMLIIHSIERKFSSKIIKYTILRSNIKSP